MANSWRFDLVPDYFTDYVALEASTNKKITTQPRLGLLHRAYPSDNDQKQHSPDGDTRDWVRFAAHVKALNREAPKHVRFKVLYLTRHGLGYHNKKSVEVGYEAWDNYWSLQNGDENSTWFDAFLTDVGIQQAKDLGDFWLHAVEDDGMPAPDVLYTSPLARTLQTSHYAFSPLMARLDQPFHPIVKEKLRERYTLHTCDLRRPRSWIESNWPGCPIEPGLAEADPFAGVTVMETDDEHQARKQAALEDLFATSPEEHQFVSWTVHSIAITAILDACHAQRFKVDVGSSLAILVRGERLLLN